jgi:endo-1,4-beta-xylanase
MKKIIILCLSGLLSASLNAQVGTGSSDLASGEGLAKLAGKIRHDFYLGAFASGLNPSREDYKQVGEIFKNNFNILTAGIYMSGTQREQGKYNLERIDALVDYAKANKIKVYFHPMIGGQVYCPEWINKGTFTKEELEKIMRDRITTILTRYKNKVDYVDVVNEALGRGDMTADGQFDWAGVKGGHVWMQNMGWYQGKKYKFPQYLVDAFRISREVGGKKVRLVLNEYNNATTKSARGITFLALIKAMKEEGIPVDDAGIQLHCTIKNGVFSESKEPFDFDAFDAMLKQYEEAGINVHITEFDIYMPENPTEVDFELQGKYYAEVLKHAIQSPAVKSFKTWGFTDRDAWNRGGPDGHPLLLDKEYHPKPAYIEQAKMLKSLALTKK